ncbi:MAG: DMT family transporter [Clostridia bacterium]|nr:DMT family transporter [Clostridia bacterium]
MEEEKKRQTEKKSRVKVQALTYGALIFVVFVWGAGPLLNAYLYRYYTATICTAVSSLISAISLLLISLPHLKKLNRDYFKVAVPTGIFNSVASLLQKIGLQYTTPTKYAFLENLSCVVVPVLLFFFIKKKPSFLTVFASFLCLAGSFILSGMDFSSNSVSFGKGEILCALAGLLYGVNIAATGAYAKKLYAPLYVMIQIWIHTFISFATAFALHFITIDGVPIEPLAFSWEIKRLLLVAALGLVSSTLCWIIRTNVMKYINASVVAVIMPFSAVIAGVLSVSFDMDALTLDLVLGAGIGFTAALLSSVADILEKRKERKKEEKGTIAP